MKAILLCEACSKPFYVSRSRIHRAHYCSHPCQYKGQIKPISCLCLYCKKAFITTPSDIRRGSGKHCSQQCYNLDRRITFDKLWNFIVVCSHGRDCPYCCWEWCGTLRNGYGEFRVQSKRFIAHRLLWEVWHHQPMPPHLEAAHYCHRRSCVSPSHIHPATTKENMADSVRDRRVLHGENHNMAKLCNADITTVFALHNHGFTGSAIARLFTASGISISDVSINNILRGFTWKHLRLVPSHQLLL